MPKGNKTPGTLVAEIKMMSHDGAFLVVEGDDDVRFWWPTSRRHASCELVDGEGKSNVIKGIQRLDAQNFEGVLGIVDSDYDTLNGKDLESENMVATDAHDLECLLCRSSALEAVLAEHGSRPKIERFENETGNDVRTELLERALIFGRLRWAALRGHPPIDLGGLKVPRFVDEDTWRVTGVETICRKLLGDSSEDTLALTRLLHELPEADPWYVARGHDLVQILRIGLQRRLGNIGPSVGVRQISGVLRAAMSADGLRKTGLLRGMRVWEDGNSPYVVLADGLRQSV